MNCAVCKAEMREGSSRCAHCGARPGEAAPAERTSSGRLAADGRTFPPATRAGATVWQVRTDKPHTVELALSMLSGREIVVVDGRELVNAIKWSFRSEHKLPLGTTTGVLTVSMGLGGPTVSLRVDGREVAPLQTGKLVQAAGSSPPWAYPFALACVAIPIVTLGGAIPGGLGFGGAAACMSVARNHAMSVGARILLCALITLAAWGLLALLVVGVATAGR
jgi:hypothetical protein